MIFKPEKNNMKLTAALLFCCISPLALAADERWTYIKLDDVQIANTVNDAGSVAGVLCNTSQKSCVAYVRLNVDCDDGHKAPMMINASVGAFSVTATCNLLEKTKYYVFDEFDEMIQAFESGGEIGFAMPMLSGQFKVSRFKTLGATAAIKQARQPAPETPKSAKSEQLL